MPFLSKLKVKFAYGVKKQTRYYIIECLSLET